MRVASSSRQHPPPPLLQTTPLHQLRLRWAWLALRQRLRRWGVWLMSALLLASVGSNDPLAAAIGLLGGLAMPAITLFNRGAWAWPIVLAGHVAMGLLLVRAARPLLWQDSWRDTLAAWPISPEAWHRSDRRLLMRVLAPWWASLGSGAAVWVPLQWPQPDGPVRLLSGVVLMAVSGAGSVWLGSRMLVAWRSGSPNAPVAQSTTSRRRFSPPWAGWRWALLWQPLWRGPAQALGRWLLVAALAPVSVAVVLTVLATHPAGPNWALAAAGLLLWVWVGRAQALSRALLSPLLLTAASVWPLPLHRLEAARRHQLMLAAAAGGLCTVLSLMACAPAPLRSGVLLAWCACWTSLSLLEISSHPQATGDHAARWWFGLVLLLALSSEITP
ncbi:hypothetical protein [Ideonella margarita]|uniref:Uncharacterized protein n=1 Tax=Ideonella margarita TaxID=2984191 RepID=A0ABU9C0Y3_9BURK